jgi:hypothetical protein
MNDDPAAHADAPGANDDTGAAGAVRGIVEEHPVAMLAGGILLGALIAGAISGPATKRPGEKPSRSFGRRAVQLASIGAELAAAYVAGADGTDESDKAAPEDARATAKKGSGSIADTALRTFGPVLGRRLGMLSRRPKD